MAKKSGKRKAKKAAQTQSKMTKAVFLTGRPNREKYNRLKMIQDSYMEMVNRYTRQLSEDPRCLLFLMTNDKKNGEFRKIEKEYRRKGEYAALSIAAFDEAAEKLYNRETDIRMEVHEIEGSLLSKNALLYHGCLTGVSKDKLSSRMKSMAEESKRSKDWYLDAAAYLDELSEDQFQDTVGEIVFLDGMIRPGKKIPEFKNPHAQILSTFGRVKASSLKDHPYVYVLSEYGNKGQTMSIPLSCTRDADRRMKQYQYASCTTFTVNEKGVLKVTVAFEKKIHLSETYDAVVGVDVGIRDMLHTSEGQPIGTMDDILNYYKNTVEPSTGGKLDLLNKKKKLKKYYRKHPDLPDKVKQQIRAKMDRLDQMYRKEQASRHKQNHYHNMLDKRIKDVVDKYISGINKDTLTVLELLDIKEFKKGKKSNSKLSGFARAQLTDTLIEKLNWRGYHFVQVEPAYTSQACPRCYNLDKANRNEKHFCCTVCGYKDDADHVGSVNIAARVTDEELAELCSSTPKKGERQAAIKMYYQRRHEEYKKVA